MRKGITPQLTTVFPVIALGLVILAVAASVLISPRNGAVAEVKKSFEVWLVDQSNTNGLSHGGTIYVYDGRDLTDNDPSEAPPTDVIDLGGAVSAMCLNSTGANPVRPHMLVFNSTDTHAVLSFVVSGHVVFFDAANRQPLACFRTEPGAGGARQAHAVWVTGGDEYVLVANQNGKKFERISTDFAANTFVQQPAATLDLANCTTPNGAACQDAALRPDNAPICPLTASDNGPAFLSLRGGGLFVVNWSMTPMGIIAEYDKDNVPANGCGFIEARGMIYGNGGGGTAANLDQFSVFRLPMSGYSASNPANTPAVQMIFNDESPERDAHGVGVSKHERYVWMGDRDSNVAEIFDGESGGHVGTIDLVSAFSSDPTPDLFASSPDFKWFFMSTRGPNPLSGDPHSSQGTTPGMLIFRIDRSGRGGRVEGLVRIFNIDSNNIERADAHGIRVRRTH